MSELYEKSLLKLELDQVLELLAGCAGSMGGKEACRHLCPSSDLEDVNLMLDQTTAAYDLCTRKGNPVFGDVTDVSATDEVAQIYAVVAGYTHSGAEGEKQHNENSVTRYFMYEDMIGYIRNHVLPYVRVGAVK